MFNYTSLTEVVGMLLFWSLGLYILTRSPRSALSALAAATQFAVALYLFHSAMLGNLRDIKEYQAWGGALLWSAGAAGALWFWTSVMLASHEPRAVSARYVRLVAMPLGAMLAVGAAAFGAAALLGDSVLTWSQPRAESLAPRMAGSWHAPPGPLFVWFGVLMVACVVLALIHFAWVWGAAPRDSRTRPQARWLTFSAALFLASVAWLVANTLTKGGLPHLPWNVQPGYLVLTAGLVILGWSVVRHGAWMEKEPERGDFLYFLVGLAIVVGLYALILALADLRLNMRTLISIFALGLLTLTTHALTDLGRVTLARVFVPGAWRVQAKFLQYAGESTRVKDHSAVLRRAAAESDEQWWYEQTEMALRQLRNPHKLAQHEIVKLFTKEGDTPLNRARGFSDLLVATVNKLDPGDGRASPRVYLILKEAYVDGGSTKEVMSRHQIPEKTYFNERKKAVAAVAAELRALAGGSEGKRPGG